MRTLANFLSRDDRSVGVDWARQADFGVRFEWGPTGAATLAPDSAYLVIVDVLSFTTSVTVAVQAGTRVFPYAWRDGTAAEFAARHDAVLAVGRRAVTTESPWSLSPAALRVAPFTPRLVLPSPNGSAIAAAAQGVPVIAGSLRSATEDVAASVAVCASGVELISGGFAEDVAIATETDVCDAVPVLTEGAFSDGSHWAGFR